MYRQLTEQAEKYLNSLNSGDNIAEQLKRMLADLLARGEANADSACRALKLSRRTLQRRLKAERTSFQKVLTEVRRDLAVRYLDMPTLNQHCAGAGIIKVPRPIPLPLEGIAVQH